MQLTEWYDGVSAYAYGHWAGQIPVTRHNLRHCSAIQSRKNVSIWHTSSMLNRNHDLTTRLCLEKRVRCSYPSRGVAGMSSRCINFIRITFWTPPRPSLLEYVLLRHAYDDTSAKEVSILLSILQSCGRTCTCTSVSSTEKCEGSSSRLRPSYDDSYYRHASQPSSAAKEDPSKRQNLYASR